MKPFGFTTFLEACLLILIILSLYAVAKGNRRELVFPSSFFFADKRLLNHNITTFQVRDLDACELLCYHNANCVSINFEIEKYKCDLNNATHIRHDDEFVDTVGYLYCGADSACDTVHCYNGGTCQSGFTDKGYQCLCPPGFSQPRCQQADPPDPVAWFPLNISYSTKEINNRVPQGNPLNVDLAPGPDGRADGSYEFQGQNNSYIDFPGGSLNVNFSMTVLCWLNYKNNGPVFNYAASGNKLGVVLRVKNERITVHFRKRDYEVTKTLRRSTPTPTDTWTFVGASYNHSSGEAKLLVDGEEVKSKNIGTGFELGTQVNARLGVRLGSNKFQGKISQLKVYNVALSPEQMEVSKNQL
ncbi:sushi, von Willebrand factor type A, EGF and pentraxin domain-containing protein 1-like [Montipora capricornis]|uniref:sushi, von Willebrand factor type A, EGF and pentraxin domain-containing protein 1-like n=1 Tax=Montipora capricornis TaxID=246305 RepID=UPI0035F1F13E